MIRTHPEEPRNAPVTQCEIDAVVKDALMEASASNVASRNLMIHPQVAPVGPYVSAPRLERGL